MITPESAEEFLKELSGDDNRLPLFRDNNASLGLRPWTGEDSAKFCQWLLTQMDDREGGRDLLVPFPVRFIDTGRLPLTLDSCLLGND